MLILNCIVRSVLFMLSCICITEGYDSSLQTYLENEFAADTIDLGWVDLSGYKNEKLQLLRGTTTSTKNVTLINYLGEQNFTTFNYNGDHLIYYNYFDGVGLLNGSATTYINLLTGQDNANITHITALEPYDNNSFVITGKGKLNNKDLSKQILLNLTDLSYSELLNESVASINAVHFNEETIYFGGSFQFNNKFNSIIAYNFHEKSIESLPFGGFGDNSVINTIARLDDDTLLFAGKFSSLDNLEYLNKTVYYPYQNLTTTNETVFSNRSISTNSTQQVQQLIPLNFATWDDNEDSSFSSIDSFMCPSSNGDSNWQGDSSASNFKVSFLNSIIPSKIRLFVSKDSNYVDEFRLLLLNGGILNLTYYDPFQKELKSCDTLCTLYNNITDSGTVYLQDNITSLSYNEYFQDFYFSPNVPMNGLSFQALNGKEMSGLQLMQNEFFVYSNNTLNNPGCADVTSHSYSEVYPSNWSTGSSGSYIFTSVESSDERKQVSVKFVPQINIIGEYTLNLYTPGCLSDNSCSARVIVNATVTFSDAEGKLQTKTSLIYQDNNEEKYDTIFNGYLYNQPVIEISYYQPITIGNTQSLILVADRVGVEPLTIPNPVGYIETANSVETHTTNTTVIMSKTELLTINGLFEYSISNFTNSNLNSSVVVGNTSLNSYTLTNFIENGISNFSLFATFFNHTLIISSSTLDGIVLLTLDDEKGIVYQNKLSTGGTVDNAVTLEHGLQLLIGDFVLDNQNLSTLYYDQTDGTFASLGSQLPMNLSPNNFNSMYIDNEALIFSFDNEVYFNWTKKESFSNTSDFNLIMKSSGFNTNGDTIFFGSLFNSKYSDVVEGYSFSIDSQFQVSELVLPNQSDESDNSFHYYYGIYINETYTGYAIKADNSSYSMIFVNSNLSYPQLAPFSFSSEIENLLYYNTNGLLGFTSDSSLYIYNLTQIETIVDADMGNVSSSEVSSMMYFPTDNSILLCGTFSFLHNTTCNGTCLYNIEKQAWAPLLLNKKHLINGDISKCVLSDEDLLYVAGNFTYAKDDYNLAAINLTSGKIDKKYDFDFEIDTVVDFELDENNSVVYVIVSKDPGTIFYQYTNETTWSNVSSPITGSSIKSYVPLNAAKEKKRDLGSEKILALMDNGESMVYESGAWKPFFQLSTEAEDTSDSGLSAKFFNNKDMSSYMISQKVSPWSIVQQQVKKDKGKTKTGYVVLFGLAMSTVTVALLAVAISVALYILGMKKKSSVSSYKLDKMFEETLESKMIKNVPPEELMKGLS